LFVVDEEGHFLGTFQDEDVRGGLVKGFELGDAVRHFMKTDVFSIVEGYQEYLSIQSLRAQCIHWIPVLDEKGKIRRILDLRNCLALLPLDAVIMAGGRGQRLSPLTEQVPKPMLKVGGRPLLEANIDRLKRFGIHRVYVSVHYLADQISDYLGDGTERGVRLQYVYEDRPLGTAGALRLIDDFKHPHILVMNADLLTTIDFEAFYLSYIQSDADMAVATVPYTVSIPFGVLETNDANEVHELREKPNITYFVNAGIYLIKRELLHLIPADERFDATDLIQRVIDRGLKLVSFPILDYWLDVGKPEDYQRAQKDIQWLKL